MSAGSKKKNICSKGINVLSSPIDSKRCDGFTT